MAVGWRVSAVNLTAEQVTFVRAWDGSPRRVGGRAAPQPLRPFRLGRSVLVYPGRPRRGRVLEAAFGFEERVQIGEDHRSQLLWATAR